ncbi:MAG TPA: ABATE domain-containing protein [Burkholderiales bacterium]|jgi:predicted RNA-binding Zn ribbon-like protein|nr:ABATE domain-containing protein [Burkholderiales bacterium]
MVKHHPKQGQRADPFEWSGGHSALDLVNSLDERPSSTPIENLATYPDLARFAALAGLIDPRTAARLQRLDSRSGSLVVKRARRLREHLHDVLAAANSGRLPRRSDLDALSGAIRAAHAAQTLVASPSPGLANRRWSPALAHEIPLHACSLAIECLLVDEERKRIRKCGASDCDVYYLDTSKGRRRQWCSMKGCGNREKQRRWRSASR